MWDGRCFMYGAPVGSARARVQAQMRAPLKTARYISGPVAVVVGKLTGEVWLRGACGSAGAPFVQQLLLPSPGATPLGCAALRLHCWGCTAEILRVSRAARQQSPAQQRSLT